MKLLNVKHNLKQALLLAAACSFTLSCTKGGSISGSSTSSSGDSGTLTITKVYPTASGSSWTQIVDTGRVYIKGLSVTVEGVCSRGIKTVQVHEGSSSVYTQTAACADDGSFVWTKTDYGSGSGVGLEGDKTLTFEGFDRTATAVSGATVTQNVRIDNTAPAIPTITLPATDPYNYTGASEIYSITGTVDSDTVLVTINGTNIIPSSGSFSYDATLVAGVTTPFTFQAWDLAGNASGGGPQMHIQWAPSIYIDGNLSHNQGVYDAGSVVSSVGGQTMEATSQVVPGLSTDSVSSFTLETGYNYITNSVRAQ